MAYQALYRQWRPKDFSHMVGQEVIIDTLRNQITAERIAHAYLFCGSRGTGKTSTAKILAKAINCEHPNQGDPCGQCEHCLRMDEEESLDIIEIDAASNNGVDEMRDLRETVKYPPQFGKYKVYIIDEVHMLSISAFNALLKTLEEPPVHVVFILATTEPQKLPATILSRCQRFDFGRIPASKIQKRLSEAVQGSDAEADTGALMAIARAAEGGMRDALSILDMCLGYSNHITESLVRSVLGTSDRSFLFRFSTAIADSNAHTVIELIDELMRNGKDPLVFAKDAGEHFRNLLLTKCCGQGTKDILEMTEEDLLDYTREGERFTISRLMTVLNCFMQLEAELRYAASSRIALENAGLKCCLRTEENDQFALEERITVLEKQLAELKEKMTTVKSANRMIMNEDKAAVKVSSEIKEKPSSAEPLTGSSKDVNSDFVTVFRKAEEIVTKTEPAMIGMFRLGKCIGRKGNVFYWCSNPGSEIIGKSIEARKEKIIDALNKITGESCDLAVKDGSEISGRHNDDQAEEGFINSLYETFGKEPVDIKE